MVLLPALTALAWHSYLLLATGSADAYRLTSAGLAAALVGWSAVRRQRRAATLGERLLVATVSASTFSLVVLEFWLAQSLILALGFLTLLATTMVHATLVVALTRPASGNSRLAGLVLRMMFSLSVLMALLASTEAILRSVFPLNVYEIQPDDAAAPPCLSPNAQGRLLALPGFRGRYLHPEFPGVRVDINALGLRDGLDEATPALATDTSVLVLGDSFTFGTGVALPATFHERLETHATAIAPAPLRIYGAGMPGYGTLDERQMLADLADHTRPDVVVVGVFEGNDFTDNAAAEARANLRRRKRHSGLFGARMPLVSPPSGTATRDRRGPPLYRFLQGVGGPKFWWKSCTLVQTTRFWAEPLLVQLGVIQPVVPSNGFFNQCLLAELPQTVRYARRRTVWQLAALQRDCTARGARLVVLVIPTTIQANPARFEEFLSLRKPATVALFDRTGFHREFVQILRDNRHTVVDMLPVLEQEIAQGHTCYHREGHWNAHGHALATAQLVPVLAAALESKR